ncbi:unnamed protein product, partial [Gulo gulo]
TSIHSSGQTPDKPRINGSKKSSTFFHSLLDVPHVVQNPAQLHRAEVSAQGEACLGLDKVVIARDFLAEIFDGRLGPEVEPRHGVVEWFSGQLVPDDRGLPLVADADRFYVGDVHVQLSEFLARPLDALVDGLENFLGVLLHPSFFGELLC